MFSRLFVNSVVLLLLVLGWILRMVGWVLVVFLGSSVRCSWCFRLGKDWCRCDSLFLVSLCIFGLVSMVCVLVMLFCVVCYLLICVMIGFRLVYLWLIVVILFVVGLVFSCVLRNLKCWMIWKRWFLGSIRWDYFWCFVFVMVFCCFVLLNIFGLEWKVKWKKVFEMGVFVVG